MTVKRVPFFVFIERADRVNRQAHERGAEGELTGNDLLCLWAAQGRVCPYSGKHFPAPKYASLDHIRPIVHGGENTLENVVFVLPNENGSKGDHTLRDYCQSAGRDFQTVQRRLERIHRKLRLVGAIA